MSKKGGMMKKERFFHFNIIVLLCCLVFLNYSLSAEGKNVVDSVGKLDAKIQQLMEEGDIPGLTLIMVEGNKEPLIKSYGYADLEKRVPVAPETLFELGSCSKAFTALAALQLAKEGFINLDDPISKYVPWFYATYKGKEYDITLRQFLHQTSGIPWRSIDLIPKEAPENALEQTVRRLSGIELNRVPGTRFEYATINYDVIGLVIEKVAGLSFQDYTQQKIFEPLGLEDTYTGAAAGRIQPTMARGYKIGFSKARPYEAPLYQGNTPAGYIVSNGKDTAKWLSYQMGLKQTALYPLMLLSHERNDDVPPNAPNFSSYAMGWFAYMDGSHLIDHGGLNPNFTSYIGFNPEEKWGVAVLANSNSNYTTAIGGLAMNFIKDGKAEIPHIPGSGLDKAGTLISYIMVFFLLCTVLFLLFIVWDLIKGRRRFEGINLIKIGKMLATLVILIPFLFGIYLIPQAMSNVSWDTAAVWSPISFQVAAILILAAMGMSYVGFFFSSLFPQQNKYVRSMPAIIILSLLAGLANAMVIFLITSALFSNVKLVYQLYYFAMAFFVYILGRKVLQTRLVRLTFDIVYDLRMRLIQKVFLTSYQRFEKMERGRVYATLNDDTGQIGQSANIIVQLITSVVTATGAFIYLFTIAFWATMVTLGVVIIIATLYGIVSQKARQYLEEARDTRNVYMGLLNGLLDGFKELSLQVNKKREYGDDIEKSCDDFRKATCRAIIKFINAFLIGESLLIVVLGAVGFAIPRIFPDISIFTLMSFIMILLYLIGPVNGILNSIPAIVQIRVAWNRVKTFEQDIPANIEPSILKIIHPKPGAVENLKARGVEFEYEAENEEEKFKVGPLDFEARKGEITFIIGGNGSGKTTLAMLLTGLYKPDAGEVAIEGVDKTDGRLGEYFSTVFSGYHLFNKLYNVDLDKREKQVEEYLQMLRLGDKVDIEDNAFTTIDLSGGQRKRLALLQCYLEDSPIYLFDEVAADQDPEFRKFFYRDLLQRMKKEGKIVIAITHDDHYFDVADKIIKLDLGKIEKVDASYQTTR
jgi:cyclic peptide transporter